MQLRVARLCLDCEELYAGQDTCPVCASERSAFLSQWLPSHERRRWRGRAPASVRTAPVRLHWFWRIVKRWGLGEESQPRDPLRTRASDRMPHFDFDEPAKNPATTAPPASATEPLKDRG